METVLSNYQPLFSIAVEHGFFAAGASGNFRLLPSPESARLLDKFGIILRHGADRVELFCPPKERAELVDGLGVEDKMAFAFRGFANDPQFSTFTDLGVRSMDQSVYLDRSAGSEAEDGRICLHALPAVDQSCLRKNDSVEVATLLGRNFDPVKPVFFANIQFCDLVKDLQRTPVSSGVAAAPLYYLRFAARKSVWKYLFLNDVGSKEVVIVDLDGRTRFSRRGTTALPGQRTAVTFVSDDPIEMQKTYPQRFQLREQGALGERILIKRLPNASVGAVGREVFEGSAVAVLVSEIYIN
jgi:hypothetical protein